LLAVIFLYGAVNFGAAWDTWDGVLMTAMVASGGYTLLRLGLARWAVAIAVVPVVLIIWAEEAIGGTSLFGARHVLSAAFELFLMSQLLLAATRAEVVNLDLVFGTASIYLLIGLAGAQAFLLLDLFTLNPFRGELGDDPLAAFTYYSFCALTTLGSNDIAPVNPLAQSLTVGEALIGNLFIAIVVARVVNMHVADRESR
jgi:hypothetical protein